VDIYLVVFLIACGHGGGEGDCGDLRAGVLSVFQDTPRSRGISISYICDILKSAQFYHARLPQLIFSHRQDGGLRYM
jgi:hypothetical protein